MISAQARRRFPVSIAASLLMGVLAAVIGLNLWLALRARQRSMEFASGVSSLEHGRTLARHLAEHPLLASTTMDAAAWAQARALVNVLGAVEEGLLSLTVKENDVMLFHARPQPHSDAGVAHDPEDRGYVRIGARTIESNKGMEQALVFSRRVPMPSGGERVIELHMLGDADGQHRQAAGVTDDFFHLSMVVFFVTAGLCLVLMLGILRFERVRQMQIQRQEQLALAGAMSGGILHDFRNPLSALHLDAQLLRKELQKGNDADLTRASKLARRLQDVLERLDALLDEAMLFARPESEKSESEVVDARQCLQNSLALAAPRFEKAGLALNVDIPEAPAMVLGWRGLLTRAFLNLLVNAAQYSPRGGVVSVCLRIDAGRIEVAIADQGPGVAWRDRRRIFGLFVSLRPGGAGLGLFLARAAIEDCGGVLRLANARQGACFVATLPLFVASRSAESRKGAACAHQ